MSSTLRHKDEIECCSVSSLDVILSPVFSILFRGAFMSEAFGGMAISGAILLGVVIIMVVVSMAAVKRGEAEMAKGDKHNGH